MVKNNVAIASAITAYARIDMMPYKLDPTCAYYDTDSLFTKDSLGLIKLGKELGMFKDELGGIPVKEAIFLDIKQYGYRYIKDTQIIEKSVFAGIPRDNLHYNDILMKGDTIELGIKTRFFKSLTNLTISVKEIKTSLTYKPSKELIDNHFIPLNIDLIGQPNGKLKDKINIMRNISNSFNKVNNIIGG